MANQTTWLDQFFLPSTNGMVPVTLPDANYTELAENLAPPSFTLRYSGTLTATRTITYPLPPDGTNASAYVKCVVNTTGQSLTFTNGGGNTITVATLKTAVIRATMAGIERVTADATYLT